MQPTHICEKGLLVYKLELQVNKCLIIYYPSLANRCVEYLSITVNQDW